MKRDPALNQGMGGFLGALALGAAAMYFADPHHGQRRRAWAQEQLGSMLDQGSQVVQATLRDLGNRFEGMQAEAEHIGQHDGLIDENATNDQGHALPQLGLAGLSMDKLAGLGSVGLAALGLLRRHPALAVVAVAGLGWWARGGRMRSLADIGNFGNLGNLGNFGKMLRLGNTADNGLDLQKTIEIKASPETVFDVWRNYDNFPHFMSHVLDVRDLGQQRSHWVVKGPAGEKVEWDAVLIDALRPRVLAWRSEPGATVEHQGRVVFEPTDKGTRVTVRMRYTPPAGMIGHGVAVLLGSDPKQTMDDDLLRMKNFIERGVRPHDAGEGKPSTGIVLH